MSCGLQRVLQSTEISLKMKKISEHCDINYQQAKVHFKSQLYYWQSSFTLADTSWRGCGLVSRDSADGPDIGLHGPPLRVTPVLAPLQQVLAPPVVRVLVEDPGALKHLAGVDVAAVPALVKDRHVISHLHGLALKVRLLPDLHPPWISHLEAEKRRIMQDGNLFARWDLLQPLLTACPAY